jgi:hypothetical protein
METGTSVLDSPGLELLQEFQAHYEQFVAQVGLSTGTGNPAVLALRVARVWVWYPIWQPAPICTHIHGFKCRHGFQSCGNLT